MAKKELAMLTWSELHNSYVWHDQNNQELFVQTEEQERWLARLATSASFAFQGQQGHLNLLKERRPRGEEGYWYAYRRQGRQVAKKYVGRTMDISIARLEELACTLTMHNSETPPFQRVPAHLSHVSQHQIPLLLPKLRPPHLRGSLVVRERLWTLLDAGLEHKITLLSAPAGSGKTSLVSTWITARNTCIPPVAWLALDEGDNDPLRFWRYFIAACQMLRPDIGNAALALLHTGQQPSFTLRAQEAMLTALLNDLMRWSGRGLLVLEDYHVISSTEIHRAMSYLVEHLPASLHLILITRNDPPLPLARLRAHGDLLTVGASHLRFTLDETRALLQQMLPQPLEEATLTSLYERTEGWVAGLRLILLALQGQDGLPAQDVERRLTTISGGQRHLLDYLVTDVLSVQPEPLQTFLLQTSGLNRLTGSLCDAVTGRTDSAMLLERIERANLFLTPLDETDTASDGRRQQAAAAQWYRYHALFAEALRHEARHRLGDEALCSFASKASRWYEEHALLADAIEAALAAREIERAATLMTKIIEAQNLHRLNEFHTQLRWLSQLPEEVLCRFPVLSHTYALLLLFSRDVYSSEFRDRLERYLQIAEDGFREVADSFRLGKALGLRALMAGRFNDPITAFHAAHEALALLPIEDTYWRNICLMSIGIEYYLTGRLKEAHQMVREARMISEIAEDEYALRPALSLLGNVYVEQGRLHQAEELFRQVLEGAGEDRVDRGMALIGLATLSYEWNRLEVAEQDAWQAYVLGRKLGNELLFAPAGFIVARSMHARGQTIQALEWLQDLSAHAVQQHWLQEIAVSQTRFAFATDDLVTIERRISSLQATDNNSERQQTQTVLLTARLLIAQGNVQEALILLIHRRNWAQGQASLRSELEILLLIARAHFIEKRMTEAARILKEALALARPSGYQRLFLDEGKDLVPIFKAALPIVHERALAAYMRELLQAFALEYDDVDFTANDVIEPLSPQERRVLRLLVAGRSNPEIAHELVVSVNTVKAQVKSIYRKLRVSNRIEASEAARRLDY